MKTVTFLLTFLFFLSGIYGQSDSPITERIIYNVRFDNKTGGENGYYQHLDNETKKYLINKICDLVYQGKLGRCVYWGDEIGGLPDYYNYAKVENFLAFKWNDSIVYHSKKVNIKKINSDTRDDQIYRYLINSLSFQEQWYFNKTNNEFIKKINGIFLFQDQYTNNIGMRNTPYIPLNDTSKNEYNSKYLIVKNIIYDVPVTRTGKEDCCNDYNWWYNYIEASKREKFFNLLSYKALTDTISPLLVYRPIYPYDTLIPRDNDFYGYLNNLYYGRSKWYASDPLLVGMTDLKIQACCFELSDWTTVKAIRFNETWYFDSEKFRFEKKVLGIGLIVNTFDDTGQVTGEKCLVYLRLNN